MLKDAAIPGIEDGFRHGALPVWIYTVVKLVDINLRVLAEIRESWCVLREEVAHQVHVRIIVKAYAENGEAHGSVLLRERNELRKFIATRFAPRGPEGDQKRLTAIFCEKFVVAWKIDQRQLRRALRRRSRILRRRVL